MIRLALATLVAVAGCYNPKINEGAFTCTGMLCPSGFTCAGGRCYRKVPEFDMTMQAFRGVCDGTEIGKSFDLIMGGALVFNTETGDIFEEGGGDGGAGDGGASMPVLDPGDKPGFQHLAQPGAPGVGLWTFKSLHIRPGVRLTPASQSKSVLVLAACEDLTMEGTIQWQGYGAFGGLPGLAGCRRFADSAICDNPRSGGGPGGSDGSGGGGGGYAKKGGNGVDGDGMGMEGGLGSDVFPATADLATPVFVGAGGGGGGFTAGMGMGGTGGNGGGAVALFGRTITIVGKIDVSGSPGASADRNAPARAGGGGGGSGGTIVVSGDRVKLDIGHSMQAIGGTGGMHANIGGGDGGAGGDGRIFVLSRVALDVPGGSVVTNPSRQGLTTPVTSFP